MSSKSRLNLNKYYIKYNITMPINNRFAEINI